MARRSFEQTVDRIRQLDASEGMVAFEMGDAVLEQAPMTPAGVNNGSEAVLQRLAEESGVDYSVLADRRKVAAAVPPGVRTPGVGWSVYRQIALYAPEVERARLFTLVANETATQLVDGVWRQTKQKTREGQPRWTVDAIRTHFGEKAANPAAGSNWGLRRAFKEATPEQIVEALEEPEVRRAVYRGLQQHEQKAAERKEDFIERDPIARKIDQKEAELALQSWADSLSHLIEREVERLEREILPRLGEATDSTRDPAAMQVFLQHALDRLDTAVSRVRSFADTGKSDIDRFLGNVLGGGAR